MIFDLKKKGEKNQKSLSQETKNKVNNLSDIQNIREFLFLSIFSSIILFYT